MKQYEKLKKIVLKLKGIELDDFSLSFNNIDLQDLLLALRKKNNEKHIYVRIENYIFFIGTMVEKGNIIEVQINLSQPLSKQKEEVYNKLIEILK